MNEEKYIPAGYKPSPLGPIPEDWEVKRLGEIGEVLMCKRIMKYQTNSCGDIPFFKIGTFGGKPDAYISREVFDEYKAKYSYPKVGDILISAAGTIGRSVIFDGTPSYYQDSNIVWIDNDNKQVLNKYLYYYYSTINWITDTGTIPRLYNGALKAIQIPTPPIEQQARVVSILELWDTAIEKQTALIEKLTLRKRGLMQQLLTWKKRLKGFSGEWKEVKLGVIGTAYGGLVNKNKEDFENGNALFITYMNVFSNGKVDTDNLGQVRILPSEKQEQVQFGDIFFTVSSETPDEVGMASVLLNQVENTYLNSFCFGYRLNDFKTIVPIFASYLFRGDDFRKEMYKIAQGSTRFNISKTEVLNMRIIIPSIEEQNAIASVLVNADKEIEIAKGKLLHLQNQKRGLMQVLLTGKKRIKY